MNTIKKFTASPVKFVKKMNKEDFIVICLIFIVAYGVWTAYIFYTKKEIISEAFADLVKTCSKSMNSFPEVFQNKNNQVKPVCKACDEKKLIL